MSEQRERYDWDQWSEDDARWDTDTGAPGKLMLWRAIQVWSLMQNRPTSIADAAAAFNCDGLRIIEAIDGLQSYYMYLSGPRDDWKLLLIEHDGE